jgi:hypothetical protein
MEKKLEKDSTSKREGQYWNIGIRRQRKKQRNNTKSTSQLE